MFFLVFGEGYIDIKDDILWIGDDEFVLVDLNMLFVWVFVIYKFGFFIVDLFVVYCYYFFVIFLLVDKLFLNFYL